MNGLLTWVVVCLNSVANALGWLLAPIAVLPGWLSATLMGVVTGVVLLAIFKHTSNQKAIKRVRDHNKANLLALKLFKDSALVAFAAQGRLFVGAFRLFILGLIPLVVMLVPVTLLLGQLSLWYQQRPLQTGEEAIVTLRLHGTDEMPEVVLEETSAVDISLGPVRALSKCEVCWNIAAKQPGLHRLRFRAGEQVVEKEVAIGDGFMRVSAQRPGWDWTEALTHPWEPPFRPDSPVHSIEIAYPRREGWTCGSDWWIGYWFIVSLIAAFAFRRALNVNM